MTKKNKTKNQPKTRKRGIEPWEVTPEQARQFAKQAEADFERADRDAAGLFARQLLEDEKPKSKLRKRRAAKARKAGRKTK